jgi:hypothetical protein
MSLNALQQDIMELLNQNRNEISGVTMLKQLNEGRSPQVTQQEFVEETKYLEHHDLIIAKRQSGPDAFPVFLQISPNGRDYVEEENKKCSKIFTIIGKKTWVIVSGVAVIVIAAIVLYILGISVPTN